MPKHADELVDHDPLLEFSNEPEAIPAPVEPAQPAAIAAVAAVSSDPAPSESSGVLQARIDELEHTIEKSIGEIALLRAEVATLVGVVGDIRKRDIRRAAAARVPPAVPPLAPIAPIAPITPIASVARARSHTASAVLGVLVGLAIGIFGWMSWSRDSVEATRLEPAPVAVEAPAQPETQAESRPESQPETVIALASTAPPQAEVPARAVTQSFAQDAAYVGTLSVDAEPGGQVFINRQPAGSAPVRVENLRAGSHLVWVERDGYRRWTRVVEVRSDRVSRVSAVLEPLNQR